MFVDLFLRSVTLGMVENGAASRPLLSSADESGDNSELKLLRVRYVRVQKDSPEFMTKHEGIDQSVDIELSAFKINIAPEPILSLYDFVMTTFVPKDTAQSKDAPTAEVSLQKDEALLEAPPKSSDKIRVRVKLTSAQGE